VTARKMAEEIWWSAATRHPWRCDMSRGYAVLWVNGWTRELLEWVTHSPEWRGLSLRAREVRDLTQRLKRLPRLTKKGRTAIDALADAILTCGARIGLIIVEEGADRTRREKIVAHERFHQIERALKRSSVRQLIAHPITATAIPALKQKFAYDVSDAALVASEMAAYIASGDHRAIGLSRRAAVKWLRLYTQLHKTP
jgi:hypothetical protein